MADTQHTNIAGINIESMAKAGMHFGAMRSRRHPSTKSAVYGTKGKVEMVDLEKTQAALDEACAFVHSVSAAGKQVLFVGSKNEARDSVRRAAESIHQPWVALRWIGGTLTNFDEIRKRIDRLADLEGQERSGELAKYTKKERLLLGREMKDLERLFGGIAGLTEMPGAMFVVDSGKEGIAVTEARQAHIPVIAFSSTDCDVNNIDYPIIGNDKAQASIELVLRAIVVAYQAGKKPGVQ